MKRLLLILFLFISLMGYNQYGPETWNGYTFIGDPTTCELSQDIQFTNFTGYWYPDYTGYYILQHYYNLTLHDIGEKQNLSRPTYRIMNTYCNSKAELCFDIEVIKFVPLYLDYVNEWAGYTRNNSYYSNDTYTYYTWGGVRIWEYNFNNVELYTFLPSNKSGVIIDYVYEYETTICLPYNSPLPIELIDFSGINKGRNNELTWITVSETNNDYFTLEYSLDGYNWEIIDYIDGAGNSQFKREYTYKHNIFESLVYYRLTQTDFDGKFEMFDPISIYNENEKMEYKYYDLLGRELNDPKGLVLEWDGINFKKVFK